MSLPATIHEQTTGQAITPAELAVRMNLAPVTATHLLTAINQPPPLTAPVNGALVRGDAP